MTVIPLPDRVYHGSHLHKISDTLRQIRIFDYPRFAEPLRNRVRERAAELASAAGITIEHIAKNHIRKEDVLARVLVVRGDRPGLVHVISAMEACDAYKHWHDKHTHRP